MAFTGKVESVPEKSRLGRNLRVQSERIEGYLGKISFETPKKVPNLDRILMSRNHKTDERIHVSIKTERR